MYLYDASRDPALVQLLLRQKKSLQDAQSIKGQKYVARKSRAELISQFMVRLMLKQVRGINHKGLMNTSFLSPSYHPCIRPISDLAKITIQELCFETHHRGSYLLLRAVTPANRLSAITGIVEDENGAVVTLQLYHSDTTRAAEDIFKEGMVFLVKEPYFKPLLDGDYGICVDHLSDVISLSSDDKRVPHSWQRLSVANELDANAWKVEGNSHFITGKFEKAIECYTRALDCSPTVVQAETIKSNRSLAFLKTNQFDAALSDVDTVPAVPKLAEKALFRKAQALYNLGRYLEAFQVLEQLVSEYPGNSEARAQLERAIKRCTEQNTGQYDFAQMQKEAKELCPPHLDHATFVGPVTVKESGSRGRALFTTRAVKAGDLLLCEKAFAHAHHDDKDAGNGRDIPMLINPETETFTMGAQLELITKILQKLYRNPSLAPAITDLHHGSYKPLDAAWVDDALVVDTFLVRRITAFNHFSCPLSSRSNLLQDRIGFKARLSEKESPDSYGIWPTASYINHSCVFNADRAFIGDFMIVRATKDLDANTEVTFLYHLPETHEYEKRQEEFQHWDFVCDCAICEDDRVTANTTIMKRYRLNVNLMAEFLLNTSGAAEVEALLKAMEDTYRRPAHEVPRLAMFEVLLGLSGRYSQPGQHIKCIELAYKALESLGYVISGGNVPRSTHSKIIIHQWGFMRDQVVDCWVLISNAYTLIDLDLAMQASEYARTSYRICVGEDETFAETVGEGKSE